MGADEACVSKREGFEGQSTYTARTGVRKAYLNFAHARIVTPSRRAAAASLTAKFNWRMLK
jgi:hypothetical protein